MPSPNLTVGWEIAGHQTLPLNILILLYVLLSRQSFHVQYKELDGDAHDVDWYFQTLSHQLFEPIAQAHAMNTRPASGDWVQNDFLQLQDRRSLFFPFRQIYAVLSFFVESRIRTQI